MTTAWPGFAWSTKCPPRRVGASVLDVNTILTVYAGLHIFPGETI